MAATGTLGSKITLDISQFERNVNKYIRDMDNMRDKTDVASTYVEKAFGRIQTATIAFFSVNTAKQFISEIIKVRGEIQQTEKTFEALLGSKEKADAMIREMSEFALKSPLSTTDVSKAGQTLLGFGVEAEKVIDIIKMLGDVTMGNREHFASMSLAFAQMTATGKLTGNDLLQMTNAGFNPLQEMAKRTGKTIGELKDEMGKSAISAEMVTQAFKDATSEGGLFYGMTEKLSDSVAAATNRLTGAIVNMYNEIGQNNEGIISGSIDMATEMVKNYEVIGETLFALIATYGTYKAAIISIVAVQKASVSMAYAEETAQLIKLLPLKSQSASADIEAAVASGNLTKKKAKEIILIRAEVAAKLESLKTNQALAASELAAATATHKAALQRALSSKTMVSQRQMELSLAKLGGDAAQMELAQKSLLQAQEERHIAVKARKVTADELAIARSRSAAAATAVESMQTNVNTISQTANANATKILTAAKLNLTAVAGKLNAVIMANPYAIAAAAVVALGYATYKLVTHQNAAEKSQKRVNDAVSEFDKSSMSEQVQIDILFGRLKAAKKGTDDYRKAKDDIIKQYGSYLSGMSEEIKSLEDIKGSYKAISEAALQAAKDRAMEKGTRNASDAYTEAFENSMKEIRARFHKEFGAMKGEELFRKLKESVGKGLDFTPEIDNALKKFSKYSYDKFTGRNIDNNPIRRLLNNLKANKEAFNKEYEELESVFGKSNSVPKEEGGKGKEEEFVSFSKQVENARKNVAALKKELADLRSGTTKSNDYAKDIEEKAKVLKEAEDKLSYLLTGKSSSAADKGESEAEKRLKEQQKYDDLVSKQALEKKREEEDLQYQAVRSGIDAKKEGSEKTLAAMKLNHEREIVELKRQREDYLHNIIANEQAKFEADPTNKGKTFNSSGFKLSSEQEAAFDDILKSAEKAQENELAEAYKKILSGYQTYTQKRLELQKKFQKDREDLAKAGASQDRQGELNYQEKQALEEIDKEFAQRSDSFNAWMDTIANLGLSKLRQALIEADEALAIAEAKAELSGGDGEELSVLRAQVKVLGEELKKAERPAEKQSRSLKEWQDTYEILQNVNAEMQNIGKNTKGVAGEIISVAGQIAASTLSMINSITQLAQWSMTSTAMAAKGVSASIIAVEKASVILAIVSAAMQVASIIINLFSSKSKQQRDMEQLQEVSSKIEQSNVAINKLLEKRVGLIKEATAAEAGYLNQVTQNEISAQKSWVESMFKRLSENEIFGKKGKNNNLTLSKLMDMYGFEGLSEFAEWWSEGGYRELLSKGYDLRNQSEWDSLVNDWNKLGEAAKNAETSMKEAATGMTFDSLKDSLDDLVAQSDLAFEDIEKSFNDHMSKAILGVIKSEHLNGPLKDWYNGFAEAMGDDVLTESEADALRTQYKEIVERVNQMYKEAAGLAGLDFSDSESAREASQKGITAASQDTVDELNGRMTVSVMLLDNIKNEVILQTGLQVSIDTKILEIKNFSVTMSDNIRVMRENSFVAIEHLSNIAANTARLEAIEGGIAVMKKALNNINDNGLKLKM